MIYIYIHIYVYTYTEGVPYTYIYIFISLCLNISIFSFFFSFPRFATIGIIAAQNFTGKDAIEQRPGGLLGVQRGQGFVDSPSTRAPSSFLFLVAMLGAPSSFLFLVVNMRMFSLNSLICVDADT